MIPMPWLIISAIVALFGTYQVGHHYGWLERDDDMKLAIAKKNEEARQTEQKLTEQITEKSNKLLESTNAINQKQSALDRAIRAGRLRISAPGCQSVGQSATIASADRAETASEPDRQADETPDAERATIAAIAEIIAQGDRNTAQLNACIDAYNDVRTLINGQR